MTGTMGILLDAVPLIISVLVMIGTAVAWLSRREGVHVETANAITEKAVLMLAQTQEILDTVEVRYDDLEDSYTALGEKYKSLELLHTALSEKLERVEEDAITFRRRMIRLALRNRELRRINRELLDGIDRLLVQLENQGRLPVWLPDNKLRQKIEGDSGKGDE